MSATASPPSASGAYRPGPAGYCAGSVAAGIRAVQIVRADLDGPGLDGPGLDRPGLDGPALDGRGLDGPGLDGREPAPGTTVVRSLPEVEALFR
jgi:hypothetical protein